MQIDENISPTVKIIQHFNQNKSRKLEEYRPESIKILPTDSETRKKAFANYCATKKKCLNLRKENDPANLKKVEFTEKMLNRGLLMFPNKNSKLQLIVYLYLKDKCRGFRKRKLLMMYQALWGITPWN